MKGARLIAAVAVAGLAACGEGPTQPVAVDGTLDQRAGESLRPAESPTIVDIAVSVNEDTGEFSTLIAAVVEADLVEALSATGQRTVFAPTDAAFAALGLDADNIGDALEDDALRETLLYHVADGRRYAEDVVSSDQIRMLNGGFNDITVEGGEAFIGGAQIVQTDIEATNGVIHVIDAVLLPSNDDGPGNGEDGDDADDGDAENEADDDAEEEESTAESPTLVEVALSVNEDTGEFSTLIAALMEAELVDALSGAGQWTVFAPTDAAFAALGLDADNIGDALEDDALRDILLYHVAEGRRYAEEVVSSDQIRMLNGGFNDITVEGGEAFIGGARIIQTDVEASNGIIHVIDAVLLPSSDDGPGDADAGEDDGDEDEDDGDEDEDGDDD